MPKSIPWNTPSSGPAPPGGAGVSKFTVVVIAAGAPRSCTNTSVALLVSPGTRLKALDAKATNRPSALIAPPLLLPFPSLPSMSTLTSSSVPVWRSRMNKLYREPMGGGLLGRAKPTKRPSALNRAPTDRSVVPVCRSWMKAYPDPSGTRLVACDGKATKRPSALIAGNWLVLFPWVPSPATLTRSVVWADATAGIARRARTPARRPAAAILLAGASEGDVRASSVVMVASLALGRCAVGDIVDTQLPSGGVAHGHRGRLRN